LSRQREEASKPRKLQAAIILDTETLNSDIKRAAIIDQTCKRHLDTTKLPEDAR